MPRQTFSLILHAGGAATEQDVGIDDAIIAGWTGRDPAAVEKHIRELEALGVRRPGSTPIFYRVAARRLTTAAEIEVVGSDSGGEVEFVLLRHGGRLWVGAGSDHTDRKVETQGVTISKQLCEKPLASTFWAYDEVAPHWDRLILRAYAIESGERLLYQQGSVAGMLAPLELIERLGAKGGTMAENTMMFGGTLPAIGGVRATTGFAFELEDPVLDRRITHAYSVRILPVLG